MRLLLKPLENRPIMAALGFAAMMLAIAGGSVRHAASTALAFAILLSLLNLHRCLATWRSLQASEKLLLALFLFYTLTGFLSWFNTADAYEYVKYMGRYLRFAFLAPIVLLLVHYRFELKPFLFLGIVLSGPAYLYIALTSTAYNAGLPAAGAYHHITFGDAAMVNALLMLLMLVLEPWKAGWKVLVGVSALCVLYASFLSQARGAWMALPVGIVLILVAALQRRIPAGKYLAAFVLFAAVAIGLSPAGDIIQTRYQQAVEEIALFESGKNPATSVGQRLAYWDVAVDVWKHNPLIGTGLGDFDEELRGYQQRGVYPTIAVSGSVHNMFVQALADTGLLGLVALLGALVLAPIGYFASCVRRGDATGYYGILFVASYAVFGLSESWIFRAPVVAIYIIYVSIFIASCRIAAGSRDG